MRELDAFLRRPHEPGSRRRAGAPALRLRGRLDLLRDVAHAHGATVNDVLLAAVAGGLRALLRAGARTSTISTRSPTSPSRSCSAAPRRVDPTKAA